MPTWSWPEWGHTVTLSSSPSQEIQACLSVRPSQSLINLVWKNKPGHSRNKIFMQPIEYTGQFHTSMPLFCNSLVGNVLIQAKIPRKSSPKARPEPEPADYWLLTLLTQVFLRCHRCTSHKDDLETPGIPRSKDHTDAIKEILGLGDMWGLYGVIGNLEVRCGWFLVHLPVLSSRYVRLTNFYSYSQMISPARAYMSSYLLIFYTNSSKERSKTILLNG